MPRAIARRWPTVVAPGAAAGAASGRDRRCRRSSSSRGASTALARRRRAPAPAHSRSRRPRGSAARRRARGRRRARRRSRSSAASCSSARRRVGEIMTPRADIFALDERDARPELALRIAQSGYSRVPIYRETLDNVIGMIHAFDVLKDTGGERRQRSGRSPTRPIDARATSCCSRCCAGAGTSRSCGTPTARLVGHRDARGPARGARRRHPRRARRAAVADRASPHRRSMHADAPAHRARTRDDVGSPEADSSPTSTRGGRPRSRARSASSRTTAPGFDALLGALHPRIGRARRIGITGSAGRGQEHDHHAARHAPIAKRGSRSASSPSIRRRRSPAARCSAIASAWRASRSIRACSSARWRRAARSAGLSSATREVCRRARRVRLRPHPHRDGRRRAERARRRAHGRHDRRVLVPESGDSIQTLKAGLMEIADIFVGQQGGPARRRPAAQRHRADARPARRARRCETFRRTTASISKNDHEPGARRARGGGDASRRSRGRRRCCARSRRRARGLLSSSPRSTGTSVILRRAASCARRRRQRLREQVIDVVGAQDAAAAVARRRTRTRGSSRALPALESGTATPFAVADELLARSARPSDADDDHDVDARSASRRRRARRGIRRQADELERLRAEVAAWRTRYEKGEKRDIAFTNSAQRGRAALHGARRRRHGRAGRLGVPGAYPFTRGIHPTGYRGKLWTMRQFAGFGSAARHERALQVPARARADRALDRVRFPDADGLRLRPSAVGGRSREVRRRDLEPRRHGDAVRRHPARPGLDVDDDQRAGGHPVLLLHRGRREAGRRQRRSCAARSRTTSSRSTWRSTRGAIPSSPRCA